MCFFILEFRLDVLASSSGPEIYVRLSLLCLTSAPPYTERATLLFLRPHRSHQASSSSATPSSIAMDPDGFASPSSTLAISSRPPHRPRCASPCLRPSSCPSILISKSPFHCPLLSLLPLVLRYEDQAEVIGLVPLLAAALRSARAATTVECITERSPPPPGAHDWGQERGGVAPERKSQGRGSTAAAAAIVVTGTCAHAPVSRSRSVVPTLRNSLWLSCVFILVEGEPDQVLAILGVKIEHAWWDNNNTDFTDQVFAELNIIFKTQWSVIDHDEVCST
jgi:hypothetical protein